MAEELRQAQQALPRSRANLPQTICWADFRELLHRPVAIQIYIRPSIDDCAFAELLAGMLRGQRKCQQSCASLHYVGPLVTTDDGIKARPTTPLARCPRSQHC